jgi:hypothetical protein
MEFSKCLGIVCLLKYACGCKHAWFKQLFVQVVKVDENKFNALVI